MTGESRYWHRRESLCIEHMGKPPVEQGINSKRFKFVLECIDTGRCWVKLSPRISKQETFPFSDVLPLVQTLVERAPNRLLWGSDWPHPQYWRPMPSDSDLLDRCLIGYLTRQRAIVSSSITRSRHLAFLQSRRNQVPRDRRLY